MDVCDTGECSHANTGECVIAGTHWAGGASHPTNPCQWCDAASSQSDWTNRSQGFPCTSDGLACTSDVCGGNGVCGHTLFAGCLISGACVVAGDDSPATECLACDPAQDAFDYTPKAAGTQCVEDGLLGTMDVCDGWGLCTHTQTDSCVVDGVLFAGGASNPENVCLVCDSAADPEGWTPRSQGFKCGSDGLECTSDVCDGVGFCVHPTYKGCLIDNVCLGDGAPNPSNICLECQAALDNSNWSPVEQGVTCGDDGDSSTVDVCDGAGLCTHNVQEFCVIGGITYEALAVNPDNSCELCDGTVAPFAWTLRSEGESCEDEGNACTLDVCDGFGACQHQLAPVSACEDKNACTDDWCDAMLGCVHGANADPCDDGNLCTDGDACADGTCQGGTTSTCNDGLLCTVDSCQPEVGCIFTPLVDSDADGICDALDNCPEIPNQDQADEDFNGVGDLCEPAPEPNPESVDDVITQDLSDGDLAVQDLFAEDLAEPDQNPADLATPDQATQDTSDPDAVLPDLASPDQSSPDQSSPDLALPDLGNPDAVEPDAVQPDSIEPDVLAPDLSKSDLSQVDGWAHDVSSDAQSDDTLEADSGGEKPTSPGGGGSCAAGGADPSSPSIGAILLLLAVALALWFRKR